MIYLLIFILATIIWLVLRQICKYVLIYQQERIDVQNLSFIDMSNYNREKPKKVKSCIGYEWRLDDILTYDASGRSIRGPIEY